MIIRRVEGPSMQPTFISGDIVIARKIKPKDVLVGDVVVVRYQGTDIVKRIVSIENNKLYIVGDNLSASTDSRNYGELPLKSAKWRVVAVWPKSARWPRVVARFQ
jgi:signal peptidase I